MSKWQGLMLSLFTLLCLFTWTMLFLSVTKGEYAVSGYQSQLREQNRASYESLEMVGRFVNDSKPIVTDIILESRVQQQVVHEPKLGDAISYGEGVSIDDLLDQININH